MKQLIIIGAGGFGRETYCTAKESIGYGEEYVIKGFLDDTQLVADSVAHLAAPRDYLAHVGLEDAGGVVHRTALQACVPPYRKKTQRLRP